MSIARESSSSARNIRCGVVFQGPNYDDASLRLLLRRLGPKTRDTLRRVLIHDQADRDAIASSLLRYRDERGDDWADIIDMLTLYPEMRRTVVRILGELEASA